MVRHKKRSVEKKVLHWIKELDKNKVLLSIELYNNPKGNDVFVSINNIFTLVFTKNNGLQIVFTTEYDSVYRDIFVSKTFFDSMNTDFELILNTIQYIKDNKALLYKRYKKYE